jgi:hypothetical protein
MTTLHLAVSHGRLYLIDKFLELGADIDAKDIEVPFAAMNFSSCLLPPPYYQHTPALAAAPAYEPSCLLAHAGAPPPRRSRAHHQSPTPRLTPRCIADPPFPLARTGVDATDLCGGQRQTGGSPSPGGEGR